MTAVILSLKNVGLTDEQFDNLCQENRDYQLERSRHGELIIMPPVGGISGYREADLITDLTNWNRKTKLGKVFSSSTIFRLPNGGDRSPDAAWVNINKWEALTTKQQESFPPICPDFVIELRSKSDSLKLLQNKMQEYLDSGLLLGWLINPQNQEVEIYRTNQDVEIVKLPANFSGENVLPDFVLELSRF